MPNAHIQDEVWEIYLSIRRVQGVNMINVMFMAGHALKVCWPAEGGTAALARVAQK